MCYKCLLQVRHAELATDGLSENPKVFVASTCSDSQMLFTQLVLKRGVWFHAVITAADCGWFIDAISSISLETALSFPHNTVSYSDHRSTYSYLPKTISFGGVGVYSGDCLDKKSPTISDDHGRKYLTPLRMGDRYAYNDRHQETPLHEVLVDPKSVFVDSHKRYYIRAVEKVFVDHTVYNLQSVCDGGIVCWLHLYDMWHQQLKLEPDLLVNIVDVEMNENRIFTVCRGNGYVIANPDQLISVTSVMSQLWCARKTVISEMFKFAFVNEVMLRGTIAHEMIGRAIQLGRTDCETLKLVVVESLKLPSVIMGAYACGLNAKQLTAIAEELCPDITHFMETMYLTKTIPRKNFIVDVFDIEETYWSPVFGLKGKLDAAAKIRLDSGDLSVVPFEFKTGNKQYRGKTVIRPEHKGQVSLYTLLMRERYGTHDSGLLLYISERFLEKCRVPVLELQYLICLRNKLSVNLSRPSGLVRFPRPDNVDYERKCTSCEYRYVCGALLRRKTVSNLTRCETELVMSSQHLSTRAVEFFEYWFMFLTNEIEAYKESSEQSVIWRTPTAIREQRGTCLAGLKLLFVPVFETNCSSTDSVSVITLIRENPAESMDNSSIHEGDSVVLSTSTELFVDHAFVSGISENGITLSLGRHLKAEYLESRITFNVDKTPGSNAFRVQFGFTGKLLGATEECGRVRDLLLRIELPQIRDLCLSNYTGDVRKIIESHNFHQQKAILQSLGTDSYLFVKGMPGSGKTTTLISLLRVLVELRFTVLVVAYTNSAVDNIVEKFSKYDMNILRVGGRYTDSRKKLEIFSASHLMKTCGSFDELTSALNSKPVVATTLLNLNHEIFRQRTFDYCVIDEASQALPPSVFGALMLARKFILFGDPDQLPPVIRSAKNKKIRAPESMFSLLSEPSETVALVHQYRMNPQIMELANRLVTGSKMILGSSKQNRYHLALEPTRVQEALRTFNSSSKSWLDPVLSGDESRSVVFMDTSSSCFSDQKAGYSICNREEAELVGSCVQALLIGGVSEEQIGVVTPFVGQVAQLRRVMKEINILAVEADTVDKFQGREKDIVICSFTKSKPSTSKRAIANDHVSPVMEDARRLYVCVTRAKQKLIFVGNKEMLVNYCPFRDLCNVLENNQFIKI